MNRLEYTSQLDVIEKELNKNIDVSGVIQKLDKLYNLKPVSMQWHRLMCKAMVLNGQAEEAIKRFKDYVCKEYSFKENLKLWEVLIDAYNQLGKREEGNRQNYMLSKLINTSFYQDKIAELGCAKRLFMEGNNTKELLIHLEELYYVSNNKLLAYGIYLYTIQQYPELMDVEKEKHYVCLENVCFFAEYIQDKKTIILVTEHNNQDDYDIFSYILHGLDVPVYMIGDIIEIEGNYCLADSVQVSMDNIQQYEDCTVIPAIMKTENGQSLGNNIPYIIDYICRSMTDDDFALTIASNNMLESLRTHKDITKRFERLSNYEAMYLEDEIGFGRAGDYCTYISRLYKSDVRLLIEAPEEYDFSIVVPVRNATETLYHTLRTCLNQEYDGSFEVVLSDNSIDGHNVAYETFKRFDDKRLKYYKTPRDFCLTKSYEFAYLQTKGKFIISIGADDGVLPWALNVLRDILNNAQCSKFNIISWIRGFYAWPGFNGGQQNQFTIPLYNIKNQINASIDAVDTLLASMKENASQMYVLPNIYINSGFRRKHLKDLYDRTGCILDGASQDVYMGLTNCAIHTKCLRINYPITIAGMSSASVGSVSNSKSEGKDAKLEKEYSMLLGGRGYCCCIPARDSIVTPNIGTDISGMYRCIARLIAKGLLPKDFFKEEELKKIYLNCYNAISFTGDKYHKYILEGYESAKKISEYFAKWYEKEILTRIDGIAFCDKEQLEKMRARKCYAEGYSAGGGVTLDASRFGVTNIYEAVQLYKDFLHF